MNLAFIWKKVIFGLNLNISVGKHIFYLVKLFKTCCLIPQTFMFWNSITNKDPSRGRRLFPCHNVHGRQAEFGFDLVQQSLFESFGYSLQYLLSAVLTYQTARLSASPNTASPALFALHISSGRFSVYACPKQALSSELLTTCLPFDCFFRIFGCREEKEKDRMISGTLSSSLRLLKCSEGEKVETVDLLDSLSCVSRPFPSLQARVRTGRVPSLVKPFRCSHWEMEK